MRKEAIVDPNNGPGTHEDLRNFGYDTKDHAIRTKKEEKIAVTVGPGEYYHEQADTQTKYREPQADFNR